MLFQGWKEKIQFVIGKREKKKCYWWDLHSDNIRALITLTVITVVSFELSRL